MGRDRCDSGGGQGGGISGGLTHGHRAHIDDDDRMDALETEVRPLIHDYRSSASGSARWLPPRVTGRVRARVTAITQHGAQLAIRRVVEIRAWRSRRSMGRGRCDRSSDTKTMNDPHVVRLLYRIETSDTLTFENPPPVTWETDACTITLSDGKAVAEMKSHYARPDDARAAVERLLRNYEVRAAIEAGGQSDFAFRFVSADVVDRNPPISNSRRAIEGRANILLGSATLTAIAHVARRRYPEPPGFFEVSRDVDDIWRRFQGYRSGREDIASMAHFCLTVVEHSVATSPGRGTLRLRAGTRYGIHRDVLDRLGRLTSNVGDARTARKRHVDEWRPHTPVERAWMEAVVLRLAERLGEYAANPTGPFGQLTMADLPKL